MLSRLLTLLQFTRMALVFTAISNGWAAMLLDGWATGRPIGWRYAAAMTCVSIGLYTFGMALNDLIDRRRDGQLAPRRPLPSGRLSVQNAHLLTVFLGLLPILGATVMTWLRPEKWEALPIVAVTLGLIIFYDFAGKYLVAPGLLALGAIRFAHACIPAPSLAFPWQAILLLVHVTLLSTVCYGLEGKRPRLRRRQIVLVIAGLLAIAAAALAIVVGLRGGPERWQQALRIGPELLYPRDGSVALSRLRNIAAPAPAR